MFLTVQFGDYRCSSTLASTVCSLSNSHSIAVVLIVLVLGDDHIFTTRLLETMRPSVLSRMPMVTSPCLRWVTTRIITNPFPKVNVTVNFGDGTGEQLWNREDPRHLWMHQYQMPGFYWVSVSSNLTMSATGHLPFFSNHFFSWSQLVVRRYFHPLLLAARNVYDLTGDNVRLEVEVVDPIVDNMGMEVPYFSRALVWLV